MMYMSTAVKLIADEVESVSIESEETLLPSSARSVLDSFDMET
jgi:hypothetical protein